jgi:parvulin-like peptidyl-prolyl isomerase
VRKQYPFEEIIFEERRDVENNEKKVYNKKILLKIKKKRRINKENKTMRLRYTIIFIIAFLLTPLSLSLAEKDKVVAKVGKTTITESQLEEALESYKPAGVFHDISPEKRKKFRKDALNDLINFELLYNEAKKRKIKVSDSTIDEVIEENIKRFGSKKRFQGLLKKQGLTMKEFEEKVRRHNMVSILLNNLFKEIEHKEDELKDYYEKNVHKYKRPEGLRLYHILIKVQPNATEEELQKRKEYAEEILGKIKAGGDFGEIAYNYSEDPYRFKSGYLGFVHKGQLEPDIEKVAFSLKEGEISDVVRSIYGFHILKAGEKKPETLLTFDEVKDKIKKELDNKRFEEKKNDLLINLKKEYPVEIYIKFEKKD